MSACKKKDSHIQKQEKKKSFYLSQIVLCDNSYGSVQTLESFMGTEWKMISVIDQSSALQTRQ